jgi:MFS transporter, Spinster family, sphingosine-1-phosphate transporter
MIRRPTTILALLTALNLLNYLDRFVLSAVLPKVRDELHLTNFVAGSLATVFLIGYFATSPIFGALADRGARKGLIALGVAVWSVATLGSGIARGAAGLIGARALVGVGEASYATLAPTIIDDAAPPDRKGRWLAVFYVAMPIGSALGYLVGGFVEKHWGWRHAFYVAGGPGIVLAAVCLLIVEPVRKKVATKADILGNAKKLFQVPLYRRGVLGYCAYTFAIGGFSFWAPTFLHDRYGLKLDVANFKFGLITVVGGLVGTTLGGTWADKSLRRVGGVDDDTHVARVNLRVCAFGSLVGVPITVACFLAQTANQFFVLVFFAEVALFLNTSPINAVILRSSPPDIRASAMALSIFGIHLLGDLWSPPFIGFLADRVPIAWAMMVVPAAIGISAVLWRPGKLDVRL